MAPHFRTATRGLIGGILAFHFRTTAQDLIGEILGSTQNLSSSFLAVGTAAVDAVVPLADGAEASRGDSRVKERV